MITVDEWPAVRLRFHVGLKREREALGMSQRQLAKACGCDHSTISYIENAKLLPGYRMAKRISLVLGVSVEEMVR